MTQLGTFADHVVALEASWVKVDADVPWEAASLVSCGVTTGVGAATVTAGTQAGDVVVVIGVGGVGMNAVQGARLAGAEHVIAVDPLDYKRDAAPSFGATHTASNAEEAMVLVGGLTNGLMADRVIASPGVLHADIAGAAVNLTRKGGTCVLVGVAPASEMMLPISLAQFVGYTKVLKGCLYGNLNPRLDMPRMLSLYKAGQLKLDELVTRRYGLDDINSAFTDLREGNTLRGVITFDD